MAVMAVLATVIFAGRADAASPARSGTIIGGYYPFAVLLAPGPGPDCRWNVDCLPWIEAGCPSVMAGHDPSLHSSIVDVRSLAGSRKVWELTLDAAAPVLVFGGVSIQFWSSSCHQVGQIGGSYDTAIKGSARFAVPRSARWMTVASVDAPTLTWTLR